MKKFLLIALAVAFGATTAVAGDVTASGKYWLSGQMLDTKSSPAGNKVSDAFYLNDFQLNTTVTQGAVAAFINWEIVDSNKGELAGLSRNRHSNGVTDIVSNYYITYKASDALTLKTGSYGLQWGRGLFISDTRNSTNTQGVVGYNIGVAYGLEMVDLGLTISQLAEADYVESATKTVDADVVGYLLSAGFKKAGPFTKLNIYLLDVMQDKGLFTYVSGASPSKSATLIGVDFAVPAGPVALAGELGFFGGDIVGATAVSKSEGNYVELEAGFKELVGFDLNLGILYSSDKATSSTYGDNWSPLLLLGNNHLTATNFDNGNKTLVWIAGSYAVNDKVTLGGVILPYAQATKVVTGSKKLGTEVDLTATFKLADNATYSASYGTVSFGDLGKAVFGLKDASTLYNKISFSF